MGRLRQYLGHPPNGESLLKIGKGSTPQLLKLPDQNKVLAVLEG